MEFRSMLHVLFPDFEKIFGMYSKCSSRKDIPDKLIVTIRAIYDGTKYFVLHQRKISAESKMKSVKILSQIPLPSVIDQTIHAILIIKCGEGSVDQILGSIQHESHGKLTELEPLSLFC